VDTNVLAGAFLGRGGYDRQVIRACLTSRLRPLIGETLFCEYEDILSRRALFRGSPLSRVARQELFAAFLSVCEWVQIYFSWRPNLPDESDNHLVELAVAGGATAIATHNTRHLRAGQLRFPSLRVVTPRELVKGL
jgi:putative PIN family toxin of toxin-antitoxin system